MTQSIQSKYPILSKGAVKLFTPHGKKGINGTLRGVMVDGCPYIMVTDLCKIIGSKSTHIRYGDVPFDKYKFTTSAVAVNFIKDVNLRTYLEASKRPNTDAVLTWLEEEILPRLRSKQTETQTTPDKTEQGIDNKVGIKLFEHDAFGKVRVIMQEGEPWFVASDVAKALGYTNPQEATQDHCKKVNKIKYSILLGSVIPTPYEQSKYVNIIPESDVYRLIMRSCLPQASVFQDWVCEDVLPLIRKTGTPVPPENETPEHLMARALIMADKTIKETQARLEIAEAKIQKDAPKVEFATQIEESVNAINVGTLAKLMAQNGLNIGQNRLFSLLRTDGWLHERGERRNLPTQRAVNCGYIRIKETVSVCHRTGVYITNQTPMVTGKGQRFFMSKYMTQ